MANFYKFIARWALRHGWDSLAEWAARNYRAKTGNSAFDDEDPGQ